ncbi:uncharacterized protein LOC126765073 [Bactrocera neohumeralis]|uniref:uncharacterized protein LOC126765073 n=1 Tax=Bactrocera neohumeralis TaxID=98809 RepID=UPI0021658D76|nr:uncharacterized protein LOC126765073 [Bactrocera neohumeralis]
METHKTEQATTSAVSIEAAANQTTSAATRHLPHNNSTFQLPLSEALKEAARIQEFRGDNTYDVTSFINEVELFIDLFAGTNVEEYFYKRHVQKKIQGEAANAIRALDNPSWTETKQELLRNFGVRESYHQLYHKALNVRNYNGQWTSTGILILMIIPLVMSTLIIQPINENHNGYVEIKLTDVQLIADYTTILHIIDLTEIEKTIENLQENVEQLKIIDNKELLLSEIKKARTRLHTLQINKNKRGLLNIVGSGLKWIAGTMDDEDRSEIENHISTIDENNHNMIEAFNNNILINNNFNETMRKLAKTIELDRQKNNRKI